MNQPDSPRSKIGIVSAVLPIILIVVMVLMQGASRASSGYRLFGLLSIFTLGIGLGLGVAGLSRRIGGSRLAAVSGILLNTLVLLILTISVLKAPTAAPTRAVDPAVGSDRPSDR